MITYLAAATLSALVAFVFGVVRRNQLPKLMLVRYLPIIPLFAVSALRYGVGKDYLSVYLPMFEQIRDGVSLREGGVEPGYYLINRAVLWLGGDFQWVVGVMSAIFCFAIYQFILDRSDNIPFSLLLLAAAGIFPVSLNLMRQMAAVAICMYALKYISDRRFLPYVIWVGLACTLHLSVVIFAPMYWLIRPRARPRWIFLLVVSTVIAVLAPSLLRSAMGLLYGEYLDGQWDLHDFATTSFVIAVVLALFTASIYPKLSHDRPDLVPLANLTYISAALMAASANLITPDRVFYLFFPVVLVLMPSVLPMIRSEVYRVVAAIVVLGVLFGGFARDVVWGEDGMQIRSYASVLEDR